MLKTVTYPVALPGLPPDFRPLRIVHLSDLHGQIWGKSNSGLLDRIRALDPHLILMTGDMINAGSHPRTKEGRRAFLDLCRSLVPLCPVYYSLGNHELELPPQNLTAWIAKAGRTGVTVLDNAQAEFSHDGITFSLHGLTTPLVYYKNPLRKPYDRDIRWTSRDTERVFGPSRAVCRGGERPTLLLAHDPLYFPAYRDWGADITFSGHIHGGIIRLPLLGGLLSPDLTFFPKYDGGLFSESPSQLPDAPPRRLIVSRGLSDAFLKRIGNPMEVVCAVVSARKA